MRLILRIAWLLGLAVSSQAAYILLPESDRPLEPGLKLAYDLFKAGRLQEAHDRFAAEAKAGKPAALFALGLMHELGQGTEQNKAEAENFYREAADKNYAPAMANLGTLLYVDPKRREEGLTWLAKGSEAGAGKATIALALHEFHQQPPNREKARELFERALSQGEIEGAFYLGQLAESPRPEGQPDHAAATQHYQRAADQGHLPSMLRLAEKLLAGQGVPEDKKKAVDLFHKAAAQKSARALYSLGLLHETGDGVEKDPAKALDYYRQAVADPENAEPMAYNKLGFFHEHGMGVEKSLQQAVQFYQNGAEAGVPVSLYNLAIMTEQGRGVEADPAAGLKMIQRAALAGFTPAQHELGLRYREGKGVPQDPVAAIAWLERGARGGLAASQLALAELLAEGAAGPADHRSAAAVFGAAAAQGSAEAQFQLAELTESGRGVEASPARAYALYQLVAKAAEPSPGTPAAEMQARARKKVAELKSRLTAAELAEAESLFKGRNPAPAPAPASAPEKSSAPRKKSAASSR